MSARARGFAAALFALAAAGAGGQERPAGSGPGADCALLRRLLAAGPDDLRGFATADYATRFDAWRARMDLTGFDACWIDDVTQAYWCLHRAPGAAEAGRFAAARAQGLDDCLAGAPTTQAIERDPEAIERRIQDWHPAPGRRVRLVQRRSGGGAGPSAVFLYVYRD
jgi:hypothetical protein